MQLSIIVGRHGDVFGLVAGPNRSNIGTALSECRMRRYVRKPPLHSHEAVFCLGVNMETTEVTPQEKRDYLESHARNLYQHLAEELDFWVRYSKDVPDIASDDTRRMLHIAIISLNDTLNSFSDFATLIEQDGDE